MNDEWEAPRLIHISRGDYFCLTRHFFSLPLHPSRVLPSTVTVMPCNLQVEKLTKSFGALLLFENLSFGLDEGDKVGLVAPNGSGKSTLMAILAGREGYDSGRITFRKGQRVAFLEQDPLFAEGMTVLEACCAQARRDGHVSPGLEEDGLRQKAKQLLSKLGVGEFGHEVSLLSGGQQKRVALASALLAEPDILFLDEPTNHLDLQAVEWLEDYLKKASLTLLMVTHDRYFLDRVCNSILELDGQHLYAYSGNYAYYLAKRQERIDAARAGTARAANLYRTELEWMRRMPQARGHKARYREEAFAELEKAAKQRTGMEPQRIRLTPKASYIGKKIFEAKGLSKAFGEKVILDGFSYVFSRYEKMGIIGDNGTGKTTFLKLLAGRLQPDAGQLEVGETVRFGYYEQGGLAFDEGQRVIEAVTRIAEVVKMQDGSTLTASQLLTHFLFPPERQRDYIAKLSGGERRRLYLCTVLMRDPNFLILDEPTNDLDILTMNVLEEYLTQFSGCLIVVSHDRYFMDKVVDHLLVFNGNGDVQDFPGNYTQYRAWREERGRAEKERTAVGQAASSPEGKSAKPKPRLDGSGKRKLSYKETMELEELDKQIPLLEKEKQELEQLLAGGTDDAGVITASAERYGALLEELERKEMRWLELSEQ